jgi:hypothetical protein
MSGLCQRRFFLPERYKLHCYHGIVSTAMDPSQALAGNSTQLASTGGPRVISGTGEERCIDWLEGPRKTGGEFQCIIYCFGMNVPRAFATVLCGSKHSGEVSLAHTGSVGEHTVQIQ